MSTKRWARPSTCACDGSGMVHVGQTRYQLHEEINNEDVFALMQPCVCRCPDAATAADLEAEVPIEHASNTRYIDLEAFVAPLERPDASSASDMMIAALTEELRSLDSRYTRVYNHGMTATKTRELEEIDQPTRGRWEWEDVYPFDDTRCAAGARCLGAREIDRDLSRPICNVLESDPETGHDRVRWVPAWHYPDTPGLAWCEDCVGEEVLP